MTSVPADRRPRIHGLVGDSEREADDRHRLGEQRIDLRAEEVVVLDGVGRQREFESVGLGLYRGRVAVVSLSLDRTLLGANRLTPNGTGRSAPGISRRASLRASCTRRPGSRRIPPVRARTMSTVVGPPAMGAAMTGRVTPSSDSGEVIDVPSCGVRRGSETCSTTRSHCERRLLPSSSRTY